MKKLRNRKTGENYETTMPIVFNIKTSGGEELTVSCESIAELNEKWEDVPEEPKKTWFIDTYGSIRDREAMTLVVGWDSKPIFEFETKEEAERAAEKLKAWQRLKDKGFRFTGIAGVSNYIYVSFETNSKYVGGHIMYDEYSNTDNNLREYNEDLTLLFGGEE